MNDTVTDTITTAQDQYNGIFIGNNPCVTYTSYNSRTAQIREIINELVDTIQNRNIAKQAFISIMLKVLESDANSNVVKELCECLAENQITKETFMYIVMRLINDDNSYKIYYDKGFPNTITTTTIEPLSNKNESKKNWYDTYGSSITSLTDKYSKTIESCLENVDIADILERNGLLNTDYSSNISYDTKADCCAYTAK